MAIFNSYVKLPEGNLWKWCLNMFEQLVLLEVGMFGIFDARKLGNVHPNDRSKWKGEPCIL